MNCKSETEEETIAVNKKPARRVSFAETTSVHIFDRDEESESPPDPKPNSTDVNPTEIGLFNEELGFRRKVFLQNDEEYDDDKEDDDIDARGPFFRPMESPSSGSGFGSATSNDEDNFFGLVSASFIRSGRLSDSAPSDENHEVTMDSTAFSMNFRSLAKSDSGGELLTSTGVHLTFEGKTPTQDPIPINQGNTMVLTVDKKPNLQSSPPTAKLRSTSDFNDMSLVGEISRRYDYGGLSPGLETLLAQTSKDLQASVDCSYLIQSRNIETGLSPNEERNLNCSSNIHPISIVENLSPSSNQVTAVVEESARKRSNKEITPRDETSRTQKSPKLCKGGMCKSEVLKPSSVSDNRRSTDGCVSKHWVDIQAKISQIAKNLISLPADKLSFQSIDAVEDILDHLMRKKKYQMLLADMQSQKSPELAISCNQHKRVVETKLLLHKLMHEQAKLQLLRLKRDLSLKKVQTVRSGLQESQMLRSNHFLLHPPKSLHIQVDTRYQGFDDAQLQSAHEEVTTLRQVLIDLERRITKLTESFLLLYKIKGQPDSADMVVLVNDYLKKRMCFRFSRLDMQLWDVDHLDSRNEHYTITLNYLGLITQRLHVTVRPLSVDCVSYELNDMNIIKNLPCVDARTAFTYVFDVEAIRKYVSSRSLAEETQISSSLLGNLLDVVEEVQLARLELRNLSQITFYSQSVEQLDLQLCFINTNSGRKAILTFNLCCLKRGVYPSEILPSHMEFLADDKQKFCSKKLLADVRAAVQSLRVGYLRIIRACRCISKVFEAANIEEYLTA